MKNFFFLGIAVLSITLMIACKGGDTGTKTAHGYYFTNHTNLPGDKITYGQNCKLHVSTFLDDSLVQSTTKGGGAPVDQIMPDSLELAGIQSYPAVFEAILNMAPGDTATIRQPVDSVIVNYLPENLKGKVKNVIYGVRVVSAESKAEIAERIAALNRQEAPLRSSLADLAAGKLTNLPATKLGVKMHILEVGTGAPVKSKEEVTVDYIGAVTATGKVFDQSFKRGQPLTFIAGAGQMIPGFDEAVQTMKHGTKAVIYIPSAAAYGEAGAPPSIPSNADICFYIELK